MKPYKHELETERRNEKRVLQAVNLLMARLRKECSNNTKQDGQKRRQTRHELVSSLAYSDELWRASSTTRRERFLSNRTVLPSYLWHPRFTRYAGLAQT